MKKTILGQTAQALLRDAAEKIADAMSMLDIQSAPCKECGSQHFENFAHGKTWMAIKEMPTKLRDAAARLDVKDSHATAQRS